MEIQIIAGLKERNPGAVPANKVFSSLSFSSLEAMSKKELVLLLKALEKDEYGYVLRAKGRIETKEGAVMHFDYTPSSSGYREDTKTAGNAGEAVVIGCGLNGPALELLFRKI